MFQENRILQINVESNKNAELKELMNVLVFNRTWQIRMGDFPVLKITVNDRPECVKNLVIG